MDFHSAPRFPRGFRCAGRNIGLKPDAKDLALFVSEVDATAAALFTRNQFPGAPVILGRETIKGGRLRAIVVNSRVSNVATGALGLAHAKRMSAAAAREVGATADRVLVSSTGVIGIPLPIEKIESGIHVSCRFSSRRNSAHSFRTGNESAGRPVLKKRSFDCAKKRLIASRWGAR